MAARQPVCDPVRRPIERSTRCANPPVYKSKLGMTMINLDHHQLLLCNLAGVVLIARKGLIRNRAWQAMRGLQVPMLPWTSSIAQQCLSWSDGPSFSREDLCDESQQSSVSSQWPSHSAKGIPTECMVLREPQRTAEREPAIETVCTA
jgi:hypothetical protein